jgi:hypothetical protein
MRGRNPVPAGELPATIAWAPPAGLPLRVGLVARDGVRLHHRTFEVPGDAGRLELEVRLEPAGAAPDALLYWSERASDGTALPEHALLLGRLAGDGRPRVALPAGADKGGWLVVYSLAHQRVVIEAELP